MNVEPHNKNETANIRHFFLQRLQASHPVPELRQRRDVKTLNVNRTFKMAASGRANVQRTWKNERSLSNLDVQESTHLPGLRQKGPGDMGNQRFIGIHEAAKRRGWTHTWLRSNQPLSSVLTPFSVPPSPSNRNSSYPIQLLLLCPPSFKDPLHLVVNGPLWVPSFSHAVIPLCFSSPLH